MEIQVKFKRECNSLTWRFSTYSCGICFPYIICQRQLQLLRYFCSVLEHCFVGHFSVFSWVKDLCSCQTSQTDTPLLRASDGPLIWSWDISAAHVQVLSLELISYKCVTGWRFLTAVVLTLSQMSTVQELMTLTMSASGERCCLGRRSPSSLRPVRNSATGTALIHIVVWLQGRWDLPTPLLLW